VSGGEEPGPGRPVRSDRQMAVGVLLLWAVALGLIGRHFGWW